MLEEGAQIVADPDQPMPMTMLGHVTSSYWSETLGRSIALAVVAGGRARQGQTLHVPMPDGTFTRRRSSGTAFFDPEGKRLSGVGADMIQERNALSGLELPAVGDRRSVTAAEDRARFSLRVAPPRTARRPATLRLRHCPPGSAAAPRPASVWPCASAPTSGS